MVSKRFKRLLSRKLHERRKACLFCFVAAFGVVASLCYLWNSTGSNQAKTFNWDFEPALQGLSQCENPQGIEDTRQDSLDVGPCPRLLSQKIVVALSVLGGLFGIDQLYARNFQLFIPKAFISLILIPWSFRRLLDSVEDDDKDENSLSGTTPREDDSPFAFLLSPSQASIVPHSSSSDGSGSSSSSFSTSLENPVLLEKEAEGELPSVFNAEAKPEVNVEALLRAQALQLRSQLYRELVISAIKKNKDNDKVHAFNYFRLVTFCFLLLLSHIWWIVDVVLWSFDFYSTGVNGVWFGNPLEQCPLKTW